MRSWKSYFFLTKPGIIAGNVITAFSGFALAAKGTFDFALFAAMLLGLSLIIASACAFNNYIDRVADQKMQRTQNRALAKGEIAPRRALFLASALGLLGAALLIAYVNLLTTAVALFGLAVYVLLYSFLKYRTPHATLIGSIAGACPPVIGYTAVSGCLDAGAFLLFTIMTLWQMPHFFAIATYRLEEYAAASIPVLPLKRGMHETKIQMLLYIIAFTFIPCALVLFHYTTPPFFFVSIGIGLVWIALCLQGFKCKSDSIWARKMFFFSLAAVLGSFLAIAFMVQR